MHKRKLHHVFVALRRFGYRYLVLALCVSSITAIFALRSNNVTVLKLRDEVLLSDKNNGDVEGALRKLRIYMYGHMNTNLASGSSAVRPPIQLKYRYERLVQAERQRVSEETLKVNADAQSICEQKFPKSAGGTTARIPCVENYISTHTPVERQIPDSLYKFDFVSPRWSPDLAGWSIAVSVVLAFIIVLRFVIEYGLRHHLKN